MPMQSSMISGLASLLSTLLFIYMWLIIIRALMSWVRPNPGNQFVILLGKVTDPPLDFIRKNLPVWVGGMDLSPIVLILLIVFVDGIFVETLSDMAEGASIKVIIPNLYKSVLGLVISALYVGMILMVVRAVLSFISPDPHNPIVQFIYGITEPILGRVRRFLPVIRSRYDFSPVVVSVALFLVIWILQRILMNTAGVF